MRLAKKHGNRRVERKWHLSRGPAPRELDGQRRRLQPSLGCLREEHIGQAKGAPVRGPRHRDSNIAPLRHLRAVVKAEPVAQHDIARVLSLALSTWRVSDNKTNHWHCAFCARSAVRKPSRPAGL